MFPLLLTLNLVMILAVAYSYINDITVAISFILVLIGHIGSPIIYKFVYLFS